MKRVLLLVGLLAAGVTAAVAVAAATTSTSVQCATTTGPAHTIGVDGSPVTTVGGDSLSVCATATATDQTVTVTTTTPATTDTTTAPTTTTTPAPPPAGTPGIGALSYGGHLPSVSNLNSYSMVIGSSWSSDTSLLASAAGRSLTYFDGTDVATNYSTGVPYSDALAKGWLLKDAAGNYLRNPSYGDYAGDLGDSGYQAEWITNVENYLAAHKGLDGVFIDNVFPTPKGDFGTYPAKYPTAAAYTAATLSFLKAVYPALHAKGYYVALNAGAYDPTISNYDDGTATMNWWQQVGPYGNGLMNENYQETSTSTRQLRALGTAWYQHWDGWQRLINVAQSQGDDFIGLMETTGFDTAHAVYGKASFLLEWNGGSSAYIYNCAGTCNPTDPSWTTDIGQPAGAKFAVGIGYERAYSKGTVMVNPSATSSQTFTVNGTSYTLAPTTAKIIGG